MNKLIAITIISLFALSLVSAQVIIGGGIGKGDRIRNFLDRFRNMAVGEVTDMITFPDNTPPQVQQFERLQIQKGLIKIQRMIQNGE